MQMNQNEAVNGNDQQLNGISNLNVPLNQVISEERSLNGFLSPFKSKKDLQFTLDQEGYYWDENMTLEEMFGNYLTSARKTLFLILLDIHKIVPKRENVKPPPFYLNVTKKECVAIIRENTHILINE